MKPQIDLGTPDPDLPARVISNLDKRLDEMSVYDVCLAINEAAYYKYAIRFHEEKYMREEVESKMIAKVQRILKLEHLVARYFNAYNPIDDSLGLNKHWWKETHNLMDELGLSYYKSPSEVKVVDTRK